MLVKLGTPEIIYLCNVMNSQLPFSVRAPDAAESADDAARLHLQPGRQRGTLRALRRPRVKGGMEVKKAARSNGVGTLCKCESRKSWNVGPTFYECGDSPSSRPVLFPIVQI